MSRTHPLRPCLTPLAPRRTGGGPHGLCLAFQAVRPNKPPGLVSAQAASAPNGCEQEERHSHDQRAYRQELLEEAHAAAPAQQAQPRFKAQRREARRFDADPGSQWDVHDQTLCGGPKHSQQQGPLIGLWEQKKSLQKRKARHGRAFPVNRLI